MLKFFQLKNYSKKFFENQNFWKSLFLHFSKETKLLEKRMFWSKAQVLFLERRFLIYWLSEILIWKLSEPIKFLLDRNLSWVKLIQSKNWRNKNHEFWLWDKVNNSTAYWRSSSYQFLCLTLLWVFENFFLSLVE